MHKDNKRSGKWAGPVLSGILAAALMMTLAGCGTGTAEKVDVKNTADAGTSVEVSTSGTADANGSSEESPDTEGLTPEESAANEEALETLTENDAIREPQSQVRGNGEDTVTVLVYMNGSNLESDDGSATADLKEMIAADTSDKLNILVETGGTKEWAGDLGIASDRTQIHKVTEDGLETVRDDMGQLDITDPATLSDFIKWGVSYAPADRYILVMWDHGGGPVYGFGVDEWQSEDASLTLDEMQSALNDAGVYFDIIGMDCCIMSSVEVGCALYDFCDYTVLSEDFESGIGWQYTDWINTLTSNTSVSSLELGTQIVDDMIAANENDTEYGSDSICALIDEGYMKLLYTTWKDFAYANETTLLGTNYSRSVTRSSGGRLIPDRTHGYRSLGDTYEDGMGLFGYGDGSGYDFGDGSDYEYNVSLSDYYITDMMSLVGTIESDEATALSSTLSKALVHVGSCGSDTALCGISVTLPYGDSDFYEQLKTIFTNCGFDTEYIDWLGNFTGISSGSESDYYNYDSWDQEWSGWDEFSDNYNWDDFDYGDEDTDYWDDFSWGDEFDYGDTYNYWYENEGQYDEEARGPEGGEDYGYYGDEYGFYGGGYYEPGY